jgi:SEC-C motif-containing protein
MNNCPCGSEQAYSACCEPLINGEQPAATAEALMRSRYTAHVKTEVDYIYETTHPDHRGDFDHQGIKSWSQKASWQGLEIIATEAGGPDDQTGVVEFVARYRQKEKPVRHHEIARFSKHEDRWYFVTGEAPTPTQVVRQTPKIGRNAPCPCGSGKKYKKCCAK